jgi:hypothetical protein
MMRIARYAEATAKARIAAAMNARWPLVEWVCAGDGSVDTAVERI